MTIALYGVSTHNLKRIDITIPKGRCTVVTGVSGSGKSSLLFDTIHAEGRFRYLETLSSEAGFFTRKQMRPTILGVEGLSPTVALEQRTGRRGSRSRVIEVAGLSQLMRVLYTHFGKPFCPRGHGPIASHTVEEVVSLLTSAPPGSRLTLMAPFKGAIDQTMRTMLTRQGFTRVRLQGEVHEIEGGSPLPEHDGFDVVVDRVVLKGTSAPRLAGSIELAYRMTGGEAVVSVHKGEEHHFFEKSACPECGFEVSRPWPGLFSRHTLPGACAECEGSGEVADGELCGACHGSGHSELALAFRVWGKDIAALMELRVHELLELLHSLPAVLPSLERAVLFPVRRRLLRLSSLSLGDLALGRQGGTLSKGEVQLLRIAALDSGALTSVTVILDEPTQGLTPRERPYVIELIDELRARGDTILIVEHDPAFLKAADHIIELGPGAGEEGGEVVFSGTYEELLASPTSLTAAYLTGRRALVTAQERSPAELSYGVVGLTCGPLRDLHVSLPYARWSVISGAMGSGKSTLLKAMAGVMSGAPPEACALQGTFGIELFPGGVNLVDFETLPSGAHSHVASYMGVFTHIRSLFAGTPLSKIRGYRGDRFSTRVKGGRCEFCHGRGVTNMDLGSLTEMQVTCPRCDGARYRTEVLEVLWRGRSINDVLLMTVNEAAAFFANHPKVATRLALLQEIGLGYLRLGQTGDTLSGGEAQRLKLGRDLTRNRKRPSLYLLDEPATGLHLHDLSLLGELLARLVDEGHTVITTDHSDLLAPMADHHLRL